MLLRSLISLSIVMFGTALAAVEPSQPEAVASSADKAATVTVNVEAAPSPKGDEALLAAATEQLYSGLKKGDEPYVAAGSHHYGGYGGGGDDGGGYGHHYQHHYHGPPAFTPHGGTYGSSGHYGYEDHYGGGHGGGGGGGGDGGGYGHGSVYGHVSYSHDTYEFSCHGKHPSFYGDAGHECRVFHICQKDGRQDTFKCPKWTRFNNYLGVCDWHFKIDHSCNPIHKSYHDGY